MPEFTQATCGKAPPQPEDIGKRIRDQWPDPLLRHVSDPVRTLCLKLVTAAEEDLSGAHVAVENMLRTGHEVSLAVAVFQKAVRDAARALEKAKVPATWPEEDKAGIPFVEAAASLEQNADLLIERLIKSAGPKVGKYLIEGRACPLCGRSAGG